MPRERHQEWIGKNDRVMPPESVQLRILRRHDGYCAGSCQRKLMLGEKWDLDHKIALEDGGENRESNLQPLCKACHQPKTAAENSQRAKVRAKTAAAYGIKDPKRQKIQSRGFAKKEREHADRPALPPRQLFGKAPGR